MLVTFSEQIIDGFLIPSFTLSQSELIVLQHPNDPDFRSAFLKMVALLAGKAHHPSAGINTSLKFVEHIRPEQSFWHRLFPLTISAYHHKYANRANPVYQKIYENEWIKPQTDIRTLPGNTRQKISLYTTLSWTNNIIFDFAGMDPKGCQEMYDIVKDVVWKGGAAILLDFSGEFNHDCTRIITITK